jgi:hypothetical protein
VAAKFGNPLQMGHYYRFSEIFHGQRYMPSDDPNGLPTGAKISVDYTKVYPSKKNPRKSDYQRGSELRRLNDLFNQRYSDMLRELEEAMSGSPKALYTAIMDSMHQLAPIAHQMMKIPIDPGAEITGCPTFEWRKEVLLT